MMHQNDKTTMDLSTEEAELVTQYRKVKEETSAAEKLQLDFQKVLAETTDKIALHLKDAELNLKQAMKLSEANGIPFTWEGPGMPRERTYIPASLNKKWDKEVLSSIKNEFDCYDLDPGWTYWNVSSLTC